MALRVCIRAFRVVMTQTKQREFRSLWKEWPLRGARHEQSPPSDPSRSQSLAGCRVFCIGSLLLLLPFHAPPVHRLPSKETQDNGKHSSLIDESRMRTKRSSRSGPDLLLFGGWGGGIFWIARCSISENDQLPPCGSFSLCLFHGCGFCQLDSRIRTKEGRLGWRLCIPGGRGSGLGARRCHLLQRSSDAHALFR